MNRGSSPDCRTEMSKPWAPSLWGDTGTQLERELWGFLSCAI